MATPHDQLFRFTPQQRALFERYIPREELDRIEAGNAELKVNPPRNIGLLLLQVRDDDVDTIRRLTELAVIELLKGEFIVEEIHSSLIVASIGSILPMPNPSKALHDQVGRLHDRLGNNARLVHGMVMAETGHIGGPNRLTFGTIVPGFGNWLAALTALNYGETKQISASDGALP